jgi:hypothetical protein
MQTEVDRLVQDLYIHYPERDRIEKDDVLCKFRDGLKCLGRHPLLLKHAFLELKISVCVILVIRLDLLYIFIV